MILSYTDYTRIAASNSNCQHHKLGHTEKI